MVGVSEYSGLPSALMLIGMHHQHIWPRHDLHDVMEIHVGVIAQLGIESVVDCIGVNTGKHPCVTTCRNFDCAFRAIRAACSADVLQHHGLLQFLAKSISDQATHDTARAPGRECHDEPDGFVGIVKLG